MGNISGNAGTQVNRVAASISAQLKELASNPPELSIYLKTHSNFIDTVLKPRGISYEMINGRGFQRIYSLKLESLGLHENPTQESAFRNASKIAAEQNKVQILQPYTGPVEGRQTLTNDSSVSDKGIKPFNETPFLQFFVPFILEGKVAGVLHVWFDPANAETVKTRQKVLLGFGEEYSAYLRNRRSLDLSQEVTRLNTYSHLLEDLAGDIDLDSVAWSLVNFSRETIECERVSIFSVKDYPAENQGVPQFEILACSGLKRPHPRSEQAEILKAVVRDFAKLTLEISDPAKKKELPAPGGDDGVKELEKVEREGSEESTKNEKSEPKPPPMPSEGKRPQFRMAFTYRDPLKKKDRPDAINTYFDEIPMNWATTLPLFDRNGLICGILLFEGQDTADRAQRAFTPMRDLAYSGGRAVGTALFWSGKRSLRMAQGIEAFKQRVHKTPRRKIFTKFGLPVLAVLGLLLMPITFKVRGNAVLRPTVSESIPAAISERLESVYVREGQEVTEGEILAELDTAEQEFLLRKAQMDFERYMSESDMARSLGEEANMQISLLSARQAEAEAARLEFEIERSQIVAPFDGVITGPLNIRQHKGHVFQEGEPIIEIAQLGDWEVVIEVREQDLIHLSRSLSDDAAVPVRVKFNADPTNDHELSVVEASQLSYGLEAAKGEYSFAVVLPFEGSLEESEEFRVGYSGNAIFEMGKRPLAYVFFRDFIHFIKLRWF